MTGQAEKMGAPDLTTGDGDPEPPELGFAGLIVDVVIDEADWLAFGDAGLAVVVAADAVGACDELALAGSRLEAVIALSSDAEVARLNGTYRGIAKPTNVLSFPAPDMPSSTGVTHLGDIIIARETVLREAAEARIPPAHHLQHLVVHGLLHLLGYDHETEHEASEMEALEVRILAGVGIADPYGEPLLTAQEAHRRQ